MKQISYVYPQQGVACDDVPECQVSKAGDVKIKIEYASICGSDIHELKGSFDGLLKMMGIPEGVKVPLGHEFAGTVVDVAEGVTSCKIGDKVTCNFGKGCGTCHFCRNGMENMCINQANGFGGMSEYAIVPETNVFVLPENITTRQASITEPTSIAMTTIEAARIKPGQSVAIIGGGPIGMLVLQLVKMQGAGTITLFDIVEEKFEIAKKLGADYVIDSKEADAAEKAKAITGGVGYEKVIECSGSTKVLDMALSLVSNDGGLVIASAYPIGSEFKFDVGSFVAKNLSISAVFLSDTEQFYRSLRLLNKIDFDNTITAEYSIDDYEKAFEAASNGKNVKVIFKVSE